MNIARNVARKLLLVPSSMLIYHIALLTLEAVPEKGQPKISSQRELQEIVAVESKALGIPPPASLFGDCGGGVFAGMRADSTFAICVDAHAKRRASAVTVRHEAYHIADGHVSGKPSPLSGLAYYFWHEPQAAIYAATGLKP